MQGHHHQQQQPLELEVASAALSRRYEELLLKQASSHGRVVPALVVTGFLGAGKTTLLQHLISSCSQQLRLGVLVNEVASVDVDSRLLDAQRSNASAGVRGAALAGGCACCAVSGDLAAALAELAGSSSYSQLDCLLLETSGVADAEPLAASLTAAGFRLTGVVAVLDSEAGLAVLQQDVAVAQLRAADVVVLNKCDLASLSGVAAVEDRVQALAPGVRMLRARFGQVPAEAFLDLEVPEVSGPAADLPPDGQAGTAGGGVQGEIAFLSHEPVVSTARPKQRRAPLIMRQAVDRDASSDARKQQQVQQHGHHHGSSHASFGAVSFTSEEPLCMACFQAFTAAQLVTATGLFRAKGFVWFQQQRGRRYVFHLSGKQRADCGSDGGWEGPPGVQLVLIGQQQEVLVQLQQGLQGCVHGRCGCVSAGEDAGRAAAAELASLISSHHRFELVQQQQQQQWQTADGSDGDTRGLVQFSAMGSVLHGVVADEVNAGVLRRANATPGLFLCHVKSPPTMRVAGDRQAAYQGVQCLQWCCGSAGAAAGMQERWQQLEAAVAPLLRKAYEHVHSCKCDVAAALQLMGR